jgi:hypothetical protein
MKLFLQSSFVIAALAKTFSKPAYAATITAEKNCVVRLDTDEFPEGSNVFVVKTEGSKTKKLAIVTISKATGGKSVGKVTKGPKQCATLKGLQVVSTAAAGTTPEASASSGSSSASATEAVTSKGLLASKLNLGIAFGGQIFSSKGAHQQTSNNVPSINFLTFQGKASIYPMMFIGNTKNPTFISQLIGLGVKYDYDLTIPAATISDDGSTPVEGAEASTPASGKQTSKTSDLSVALITRAVYMQSKLNTQLHLGYALHSLTHTLGEAEGLVRSPLRNFSLSGLYVGLRQEVRMVPFILVGLDGRFLIGAKSKIDITSEQTQDRSLVEIAPTESASGLAVGFDASAVINIFQVGGAFQYQSFSSNFTTLEGVASKYSESQMKFSLLMGILL